MISYLCNVLAQLNPGLAVSALYDVIRSTGDGDGYQEHVHQL